MTSGSCCLVTVMCSFVVSGKDLVAPGQTTDLRVSVSTYQCYYEDCLMPEPMSNVPADANRSVSNIITD